MGYYRSSCSPYDVQANQGGNFDFVSVKKRYQETTPLRGKRKEENIRPINRRDRAWERIVEVNENEYYVTFDAWRSSGSHNKAITWCLNDDMETMTIHTPRVVWGTSPSLALNPRALSSSSYYWFYHFNMPHSFSMENHRANKYVCYQDKYYSIELGDIVFQRKQGNNDWLPLVVHREFKHTLDRTKTKELRESIKPFMAYYDVMCEIVEGAGRWQYGNPIYNAIAGEENRTIYADEAIALFKPTQDGGVPDGWLSMVERYKHRISGYDYQTKTNTNDRHRLPKEICNDLFRIVKPCIATEVPIGILTHDRYKGWFR